MAKFTFLELHLDGAQISANAPFSSQSDADVDDALESDSDDAEDDGGLPLLAPVLGLVVLAVVAVAVKHLLDGGELPDVDAEGPEIEIDS